MAKSKEEQIFIGENDTVIELTGEAKEQFLLQRAKDEQQLAEQEQILKKQKELKIAAYAKLGLTEEEINAIL